MQAQCLISFGSNLGDRHQVIATAARMIADSSFVDGLRTSRLFATPPVGGPGGQEPFLNAVGAFETEASAREILDLLQRVELELGRKRLVRWGARSIDLDVVLHGELVGGGTGLIVPHPRYTSRRFVLEPACDVAPHYRDPRFGWTLRQLCDHLSLGAASLALTGDDEETRHRICALLSERHGIRTFQAKPITETIKVVGNVPAPGFVDSEVTKCSDASKSEQDRQQAGCDQANRIDVDSDEPWVSAFVPELPELPKSESGSSVKSKNKNDTARLGAFNQAGVRFDVPRLVARLQRTTPQTRWPAPHQMWPASWDWPEYRLEVDDVDWAVDEVASAIESMRCPVEAESSDGHWW